MSAKERRNAPVSVATSDENKGPGGRVLWRIGRLLLTASSITFAVAAWTYFATVNDGTHVLTLNPGDVDTFGGGFTWALFSVLSLILLPYLWLTTREVPKFLTVTILFGVSGYTLSQVRPPDIMFGRGVELTLVDGLLPHTLAVMSTPTPLPGYIATLTAGTLSLISAMLLYVAVYRGALRLPSRSRGPSRVLSLPGAGAFTLAIVMLLASVFVAGWAADNCTASPLLVGSCTGLTFNGVAYYGIQAYTDLFDPIASLHAIPLFIVLGAALILLALWAWRRITPGLCLWITLWLAAVTFFVIVAVAGVGVVTEHAADLGLQAGTWKGQSGAYLAGAGLLVGWLALVSLWYAALRGDGVAQVRASSADDGTERR